MKTALLKGADKEGVKSSFLAGSLFRDQLKKVLDDKIKAINARNVSEENYASPNWPYKQADSCGYVRAMQEVLSLIED